MIWSISTHYVLRCLILAVVYGSLSLLGQMLALPPGFASPVWPAAGAAVCFLLLQDVKLWPGIWLASWLFNASLTLSQGTFAFVPPAIVASGAALQAVASALIGRPILQRMMPLQSQFDCFRFLLWVGPVCCLISASIGVASLFVLDLLLAEGLLNQWVAWWAGDTLGVLLCLPLAYLIRARSLKLPAIPTWSLLVPLLIVAALVVVSLLWLDRFGTAMALDTEWYKALLGLVSVTLTLMMMASLLSSAGREMAAAQEVLRRKRIEKSLQDHQFFLQEAGNLAKVGGWSVDLATRTLTPSEQLAAIIEWPAETQLTLPDFLLCLRPDSRTLFEKKLEDAFTSAAYTFNIELEASSAAGRLLWLQVQGRSRVDAEHGVQVHGAIQCITERHQSEHQRNRAQRLQALGNLSGGIAHDLNNALTPVLLLVDALKSELPAKAPLLSVIERSTEHSVEMLRRLMTFAKGAEGERKELLPNGLLEELLQLVKSTFPKNILLRAEFAPDLPRILGNRTQLHQVLLNICVNARDALANGGEIVLRASTVNITDPKGYILDAKVGPHLMIQICDNGDGIAPELLTQIFDPFFTTKGVEKGMGLGLSTVLGITRSHEGFLQVASSKLGTQFSVYLPIATGEPATADVFAAKPETTKMRGNVLLVDDDVSLLEVAGLTLSSLGFTPLPAASGAAALELVANFAAADIVLVITDLRMPGMDGLELVSKLRQLLPTTPIVVSSGLFDDQLSEQFRQWGVTQRIDKPYRRQNMSDIISKALAAVAH